MAKNIEFLGVRLPTHLASLIDDAVKDSGDLKDRSDVVREALTFYFAITSAGLDKQLLKPDLTANGNFEDVVLHELNEIKKMIKRKR